MTFSAKSKKNSGRKGSATFRWWMKKNRVVGLVTQRDLFRILPPHKTEEGYCYDPESLNTVILKRVMTPDPVTLRPDDFLATGVEIMARNKFGAVPVVDSGNQIVGILTETDVLKFVAANLL